MRLSSVPTPLTASLLLAAALSLSSASSPSPASNPFVSVPLHRRPKPVRSAFAPPWHRRWSPPVPGPTPFPRAASSAPLPPSNATTPSPPPLPSQPMYGDLSTLGEYYLELPVGGQVINVQIDTGSSTLAVPLKDCTNCLPHDHRFDPANANGPTAARLVRCGSDQCRPNTCHVYGRHSQCSACSRRTRACCSSVDPDKCGFFLQYADGSGAAGALVTADVELAGLSVPLTFGSILRVSRGFENPAVDGILGMAFKSLACNPTCVTPLFDALVEAGKVKRDVFSLCTGRHGGTLTLGGSNPSMYKGKLQYVPLSSRKVMHFYDVDITGVEVGGKRVPLLDFSDGIVDSGTTVLVIAPKAYHGLREFFQTNYCHVPGLCPQKGYRRTPAEGFVPGSAWEAGGVKFVHVSPEQAASVWKQSGGTSRRPGMSRWNVTARSSKAASAKGLIDDDDDEVPDEEGLSWFSPGMCASLSETEVAMLPTINILLKNGVELNVGPEDYMLRYELPSRYPWSKFVYRCLGMTPLPGLAEMENNVIIGDSWLQKFFVEYDRENMRVGFAPSQNCVAPGQERTPWLKDGVFADAAKAGSHRAFSPFFLGALAFGTVASWIVVVWLCKREQSLQPKREEYEPIR